jgi:hypothetical protein
MDFGPAVFDGEDATFAPPLFGVLANFGGNPLPWYSNGNELRAFS